MSSLDSLSFNISKALNQKFPDIDAQHYSPNVIKDFIIKTNSNYQSNDGVQKIIIGLTNNLNQFKLKMNKTRQTKGLLDLSFNPANQSKTAPIPQQNLVKQTQTFTAPINTSRREYINPNPLIIDSGMVNQINNQQVYLNQIDTNNNQRDNYQSYPSTPNLQNNMNNMHQNNHKNGTADINVNLGSPIDSILNNLPTSLPTETPTSMSSAMPTQTPTNNHTDRFILTEKQRNLIKEDDTDVSYYIVIDSKDRDMNIFRSPNEYTIRFSPPNFNGTDNRKGYVDKIFHNVKSIELVRCGFLDTSEVEGASDFGENDPAYVMLEIEEFITQHNGTNQNLNNATIIMDSFSKIGKYKYYDLYDNFGRVTVFNPRITLNSISIKFRLPSGELYKFGDVNDTNQQTVNYMVFRVVVMQKALESSFFNKTS
jgi:hypothetical protein